MSLRKNSPYSKKYYIQTLEEAHQLSVYLSEQTPHPIKNLIISELMFNAIEHGNLGITYEEKAALIESNRYLDEIEKRLQSPENRAKYAIVEVKYLTQQIIVSITDTGPGFDFRKYLNIDETKLMENHGRGIALANSLLKIRYNNKGNQVKVFLPLT